MLLVTAEEMRALDRATIESGHATGDELMERAGAGVMAAMERHFGSPLALRVMVLCGPGNNGGDGFVVARHLHARGAEIHVGLLADRARIQGDAKAHLGRLERSGVTAADASTEEGLGRLLARRDGWDFGIDALLGTGARPNPTGALAAGVRRLATMRVMGAKIVAVDLPTGVDADTGEASDPAVQADLTVSFGHPKRGHFLYPGRAHAGALEIVDIGLDPPSADQRSRAVEVATEVEMAELVPYRDPRAHKGSVGRVLVIGGSPGLTGAVLLAARAASRAGAGYVQAAVPAAFDSVFEIRLTEEMSIPLGPKDRGTLGPADWEALRSHAGRADVIAIGSGLSRDPGAAELARRVARDSPRPLVIDADALNAFEGRAAELGSGPDRAPRVLTPHVGEMARLSGLDPKAIEARRIDVARECARAWDSIVVLKGAPTVTAHPGGHATVNPTGNPGMATAGMGDVLTGVIAALAGAVPSLEDASRLAVYLHGRAGDLVAASRGMIGMCASDVIEKIPEAIRDLGAMRAPR